MRITCSLLFSVQGKWALVTGASRGVGWAIVEKLASEQANLILVARTESALQQVAPCMTEGV